MTSQRHNAIGSSEAPQSQRDIPDAVLEATRASVLAALSEG